MMNESTLFEVIRNLGKYDGNATIYAACPWTQSSQAVVAEEPESGGLPSGAEGRGLRYFLEVSIAREFVEEWSATLPESPTAAAACERLIQYVLNDA